MGCQRYQQRKGSLSARSHSRAVRTPQHSLQQPYMSSADRGYRLHQEAIRSTLVQGTHRRAGVHGMDILGRRVDGRTHTEDEGRRDEADTPAARLRFCQQLLQQRHGRIHHRSVRKGILRGQPRQVSHAGGFGRRQDTAAHGLATRSAAEDISRHQGQEHYMVCAHRRHAQNHKCRASAIHTDHFHPAIR